LIAATLHCAILSELAVLDELSVRIFQGLGTATSDVDSRTRRTPVISVTVTTLLLPTRARTAASMALARADGSAMAVGPP